MLRAKVEGILGADCDQDIYRLVIKVLLKKLYKVEEMAKNPDFDKIN